MLKVLDVEGAVERVGRGWRRRDGTRLALRRRPLRRGHGAAPARAGGDGRVRRRRPLPHADAAGGARRPRAARLRALRRLRGRALRAARSTRRWCAPPALHLRSRPLVLEVKKMAPGPDGAMRKLPDDVRAEEGRALARLGDGGWDPLVQAGRRAGRFDDELVDAAAEAVRGWGAPVAWVAAGPLAPQRRARARPGGAARARARRAVRPGAGARARRRRPSARWRTRPSRWPTCAAPSP